MPTKIDEKFGEAVKELLDSRGLSTRGAKYKTGIDAGTILNMRNGEVPRKGVIIDFAQKMGEPINKWLELAGYDLISTELLVARQSIPDDVKTAIEKAKTRTGKINLAFEYVRKDKTVKFGSTMMSKLPSEAKYGIIRMYEDLRHVKLLPEEMN